MGLDFSKPASQPAVQTQPAEEAEVVEQYDIVSDRQQMNTELTGSPEVDALVSQIEVHNLETIVSFGAEAAEEISKCSDIVLNNMNMSQLDDSSEPICIYLLRCFGILRLIGKPCILRQLLLCGFGFRLSANLRSAYVAAAALNPTCASDACASSKGSGSGCSGSKRFSYSFICSALASSAAAMLDATFSSAALANLNA